MRFYRIKQTDKDTYIPQVWEFPIGWKGIDKYDMGYTFYIKDFQEQFCTCDSLEKAKSIIDAYKEYIKSKKQYPKYHKL